MPGAQDRGWRMVLDGESRPTSRGIAHREQLTVAARSTLAVDFGTGRVNAAVAYHDRNRIAHLHGAPAYLLQHVFGVPDPPLTVDTAARILERVRDQAASLRAGLFPTSLWLTRPTRPDDARATVLEAAAARAGFTEPTYIDEPLAAAACFEGCGAVEGQHVAVFDVGTGDCDAALLRLTGDGATIVSDCLGAGSPSAAAITGSLLELTWEERVRRLAPVVDAAVDRLLGAARAHGVATDEIAAVYLGGELSRDSRVAAFIADRVGQVPICVSGGNEVALGAANASLGAVLAWRRPIGGDDEGDRGPRLYSPRRLMPTISLDDFEDPCPDIVIIDRDGNAAVRQSGVWHAGLTRSHHVIADMYRIEDHAECFWLMDEATRALGLRLRPET